MRLLDKEKNPRNAALMTLIYAAGLRVSEACGLRWKDMKSRGSSGQATIFGKGGKTRAILLPPGLWGQLTALRGDAGPEDFVFRSRKGGAGIFFADAGPLHRQGGGETSQATTGLLDPLAASCPRVPRAEKKHPRSHRPGDGGPQQPDHHDKVCTCDA
jgi:Phage integrase family